MDDKIRPNEPEKLEKSPNKAQFYHWVSKEAAAERTSSMGTDLTATYPLAQVAMGKTVWLVGFQGTGGSNRLLGMGLNPGIQLQVISSQGRGSVLIGIQDNRIGIGAEMAEKILVSDSQPKKLEPKKDLPEVRTFLREIPIGKAGKVVGYDRALRGYKGKLLSMGLTPGTEFTVIRVAPLGDPVEIRVRGFHLSLRKQEADTLIVEEIDPKS
ncbi:MAG: ferrous iron transport protein A [Microcystis novacekii Mn_MB_F_20050700_S1]|uniref:Ferrous iron transport protein A n=2 Tax=Microcystis TaxID=1125 RepID=A0A552IS73_9CHRO|nr:MAG: ferrous iron transport protein A [Microcystis novacekii Mn_MB_F_20050700_S1D]TRU86820.1 MAG: ferrous iron transport protein A [Microcystis novacekii Mn_MB_F_20050700_S1]